jgi:hypothetical protein
MTTTTQPSFTDPVGAPTPDNKRQPQFQLSGYQIMRPRQLPPYVLALWYGPRAGGERRGLFVAHYDLNGRLLATPGWAGAEPPALPDAIVAGLTSELHGSPPVETQAERELRLGGFRNARVLRQEIARRGRQVQRPTTRIRRRTMVDGRWVAQEGAR